jgi:hypothetical protein
MVVAVSLGAALCICSPDDNSAYSPWLIIVFAVSSHAFCRRTSFRVLSLLLPRCSRAMLTPKRFILELGSRRTPQPRSYGRVGSALCMISSIYPHSMLQGEGWRMLRCFREIMPCGGHGIRPPDGGRRIPPRFGRSWGISETAHKCLHT